MMPYKNSAKFAGLAFALFAGAAALTGCQSAPSEAVITEIAPDDLPASVSAAIAAERPNFTAVEILKKVRSGRVYYDVEGELTDGSEIEFDVLMDGDAAQIVEIQRDLDWAAVPEEVRQVALSAGNGVVPVRTIESTQTDGSVIYEFFVTNRPEDPAYEIRTYEGAVELLSERWMH